MNINDSAALALVDVYGLTSIFNAVPSACLVVSPDFLIIAINDAHLRSSGAVRAQVLGRNIFDAFPANPAEPEADGIVNVRASILRVLETRSPDEMPVQRYDVPIGGSPDEGFAVRYWKPVHVPVFDSQGEVAYVVQHVENVTQQVLDAASVAELTHEVSLQSQQIHDQRYISELFQQAPAFMAMLIGPTHRIEFVNKGYLKLIGGRNIIGLTFAQGLPEAAEQGYVRLLDEVFATGTPYVANAAKYAVQATVGGPVDERYLDFVYQPIRDSNGGVTGTLVQGVDVTDRILAEVRRDVLLCLANSAGSLITYGEVLCHASAVLGKALKVSRVGYGTIDVDAETLTVVSDWTAPDVETLAGTLQLRHYVDFIDDLKRGNCIAINDVACDPRTKEIAASLKTRSAGSFVNVPVLEQGKLVAVIFVNHAEARSWGVEDLALIKEVADWARTASERLRSVTELRFSEAKFRTIADAMPQMVWSTLPNGVHDYFNPQWYEFTGLAHGSSDGDGWNQMLHPADQEGAWSLWHECLATGNHYEIQYRLRHFSGQYRWVLGRALPVLDESGCIVRWMGTCTNIHAQKLAEDDLQQQSQRKDEFLAMLAHELRNPLAPISSAAQFLSLAGTDPKRVTQASEIIRRQVKHMSNLIDDLLDVSRLTRGLIVLESGELDLKVVISSAVEQAQPLLESRHHELLLRLPSALAFVLGDKTRIVQAVTNLLNNAAKYTPQGGKISLTLEADEEKVTITVSDNGIGIPEDLLPRVFDLFTQAERTPDRAQCGLGLGLALVKNIASLHGGTVWATSGGNGKGSSFSITLPLITSTKTTAHSILAGDGGEAATALHLVVVDDNQDAALALSSLLSAAGHEVHVYKDAQSALTGTANFCADVFILDIGLPDIDGFELARRLRADVRTARTLLIALTGYGQAHDRVLSKAAGIDYHFVKPVDYAQLSKVLAQVKAKLPTFTKDGLHLRDY